MAMTGGIKRFKSRVVRTGIWLLEFTYVDSRFSFFFFCGARESVAHLIGHLGNFSHYGPRTLRVTGGKEVRMSNAPSVRMVLQYFRWAPCSERRGSALRAPDPPRGHGWPLVCGGTWSGAEWSAAPGPQDPCERSLEREIEDTLQRL